jgi:hypothetical protein
MKDTVLGRMKTRLLALVKHHAMLRVCVATIIRVADFAKNAGRPLSKERFFVQFEAQDRIVF